MTAQKDSLPVFTESEKDIVRAAQAAIRDFANRRGGDYSGPETGVYLRILGTLQTYKAQGKITDTP